MPSLPRLVAAVWLAIVPAVFASAAGPFGFAEPIYFPGRSLGQFSGDTLVRLSGAAVGQVNPGVLWVHNDGPVSEIHAILQDGSEVGTLSLGTTVTDLEAASAGPGPVAGVPYLYFGDIGTERSGVRILRAPEPSLPRSGTLPDVVIITLNYPDGAHDAQTLMVDPLTGDLFVVTKEPGRARFYRATAAQLVPGSPAILQLVADIPFADASGGDISSDGQLVVLRSENAALMWKRDPAETVASAVLRPGTAVPVVGQPAEPNGEAIAFVTGSPTYLTVSEEKKEPVFQFRPNPSGFGSGDTLTEVADEDLREISGCAASARNPGVLWVHGDGDIDRIFAIDSAGDTVATVMLGRTLFDAEDIVLASLGTPGSPHLFVGDIGDNDGSRPSVGVLRFPEPVLPAAPVTIEAVGAEYLALAFPGGATDCEALLFDPVTGTLLLATKEDGQAGIFSAPAGAPGGGSPRLLAPVATVPFSLASAGAISPDGGEIILRREDRAELWSRLPGDSLAAAFAGSPREVPVMTPPVEPNGESLAFAPDGSGYFTVGEDKNPPVFFFRRLPVDKLIHFAASPPAGGGTPTFLLHGFPEVSATVESSDDLLGWTPLGSIALDHAGTAALAAPPDLPRAFFRLRR